MDTPAMAAPSAARTAYGKVRGALTRFQQVTGLLLILVIAVLLSPVQHDNGANIFLSGANLTDIFRQVSENGIIALGMTFVILTGGIDLSVGSLLALSATFLAKLLTEWSPGLGPEAHIALAMLFPLLLTTAFGALYGLIIAKFGVQPFIVTLAGMIGLRGFARFLTTNASLDIGFGDDVSAVFADLISPKPVVIGTFVVLSVAATLLLSRTVFGLRVKSIGDNPLASRYAGLPVAVTIFITYAISGLLSGAAGILHAAQNHQGNPNDGVAYELDAIAAVVIGGTKMTGGKGSIPGTIVGVFIIGILTNMFRLRGIDINVEMMFKAAIIVIAVRMQMPGRQKA